MLSLKETCMHAQSNKPYITALTGGKDNSPEGLQVGVPPRFPSIGVLVSSLAEPSVVVQNGIQYAFVAHFATAEDRDYYVKTDPVHQEFVKANGPLIEKAIVVDYTMGEF